MNTTKSKQVKREENEEAGLLATATKHDQFVSRETYIHSFF